MFWEPQNCVCTQLPMVKQDNLVLKMEEYSYKNKGGRPVKNKFEKRMYPIRSKLTLEEKLEVKSKIRKSGLKPSEYMRQALIGSTTTPRLSLEEMEFIRKLCGMTNNLNQIARKANTTGYKSVKVEHDEMVRQIDKIIDKIKK